MESDVLQEKIGQLTEKISNCDIKALSDEESVSLYKQIAPMLLNVLIGLNNTVRNVSDRDAELSAQIKQLEKTIQSLKMENERLKNQNPEE